MFACDDVALPLDLGGIRVVFESSVCISDVAVPDQYAFTFADALDDLYTAE